jgi:peptide/nickel transport system substrate-binding protein
MILLAFHPNNSPRYLAYNFSKFIMHKNILLFFATIFILVPLIGCQPKTTSSQTDLNPTATPNSPRTLTICLGYEPENLYLYSASSQAAWSVLEAIYDGPIDIRNYQAEPVILDKLPSFTNGGAHFTSVNVKTGDQVADIHGNPVVLVRGVEVFPHGCTDTQCAIQWDGIFELQMDQISATYKLLPGINWSDGYPLRAMDSVYAYHLAGDPATPNIKTTVLQTSSYTALDDLTIEWKGKPGLLTQSFEKYFWLPLPQHAWGKYSPLELLTNENSTRHPLGWGPYILQEWQPGKFIRLKRNPLYFRASQGLPKFDTLIFKFINIQGDTNLMGILRGECDFVNQTTLMLDQTERLEYYLKYYSIPQIKSFFGNGPSIEYLIFNTQTTKGKENSRPSLLADPQLRQAVAYCLERPEMNKDFFNQLAQIPLSYLPPANPYYVSDLQPYTYDLKKGQAILESLGWQDTDHNPQTPRTSSNVTGIENGIPLTFKLIADQSVWRRNVANYVARSLQKCGFGVELTIQKENEYLSPQGSFWHGDFDLAVFAWSSGKMPPCYLLSSTSQAMLDKPLGSPDFNIGRYSNPEFDQLCLASLQPLVNQEKQIDLQNQMQRIINQELPILPLFSYLQVDVARPDFCSYELDISARSDLWNIESMDYGPKCAPLSNR